MGVLTVVLKKIDHLRDKDGLGKSDPYVVFSLETDNWLRDKDLGTYTSTKKKNDISPEYNETFTFHNVSSLNNLELSVKVMDDDFGRDDYVGGCTFKLENCDFSHGPVALSKDVDNKVGIGWLNKNAKMYIEVMYTK